MRITRYRDWHKAPGYFNPETAAKERHAMNTGNEYDKSMVDCYKTIIHELFAPYAWPGGYPVIFTTDSGDCLCADCARDAYLNEKIDVSSDVHYEGPSIYCDECNVEIESAYGDPGDDD
jgi:hypothetical protein